MQVEALGIPLVVMRGETFFLEVDGCFLMVFVGFFDGRRSWFGGVDGILGVLLVSWVVSSD